MLDFIRKKQKSVLVQLVFWAIIATFVGTIFLVWGKGDDNSQAQDDFAVKVNGDEIGVEQFQRAYASMYRVYQNLYGDAFTPAIEKKLNLRKQALDSLIDQMLLLQEADRRNLTVSDKDVVDAIAKITAFQDNGVFDRSRYVQILRSQRLTPEEFEEMQRRELLVEAARKAIEGEASATDAEIEQEYKDQNEKIDLSLVRIDPALFEGRVQIDPAQLQTYFNTHKDEFKLPDTVNLQYVIVDPKTFADAATVADTDLEKYYQRHIDRFEVPEQVRASHILIRVSRDATAAVKAEKKALAEKLRDRAKKGEDFAALARSSSEDPGSSVQGGDLGFFGRGMMVAPFENAAFALNPGEISDVVETDFGYHILRVAERHDARIKPMNEVMDQVRALAKEDKSRELAQEKAMDLFNMNRKGGSLQAAAGALGAEIRETGFFTREQPNVAGLALPAEVCDTAFGLTPGELGRPALLPQGVILFALKEKRPAHVPELAEVRPAVEAAFRKSKAKDLAKAEGTLLLAEVRSGADIMTAAAKRSLSATSTGLFARNNNYIPMVGTNEEMSKAVFELTPTSPVLPKTYEVDNAIFVVRLKKRVTANPSGLTTTVKDEMRKAVLERKKKEILDKALKSQREKSSIIYSPSFEVPQEG